MVGEENVCLRALADEVGSKHKKTTEGDNLIGWCASGFRGDYIEAALVRDDAVLVASWGCDLQHALGRFAAECEAVGMRKSTKSEAMVLDWKRVGKKRAGDQRVDWCSISSNVDALPFCHREDSSVRRQNFKFTSCSYPHLWS